MPREGRDLICIGAVPDREEQLVLFDRSDRCRLIVDEECNDPNAGLNYVLFSAARCFIGITSGKSTSVPITKFM
jgi:hypothetical protein